MTIPIGTAYTEEWFMLNCRKEKTSMRLLRKQEDDYFVYDDTHVFQVEDVGKLKDMGHGVLMERKGVSGKTQNQLFVSICG